MRTQSAKKEQQKSASGRTEKKTRSTSPHDMVQGLQKMNDEHASDELRIAAEVETRLRHIYPCEVVKAEGGIFTVDVEAPLLQEAQLVKRFNEAVKEMDGVKEVRVHIMPSNIWGLG